LNAVAVCLDVLLLGDVGTSHMKGRKWEKRKTEIDDGIGRGAGDPASA